MVRTKNGLKTGKGGKNANAHKGNAMQLFQMLEIVMSWKLGGKGQQGKGKKGKGKEPEELSDHGNLMVKGIPEDMDDASFRALFEGHGEIVSFRCVAAKGYGFVQFSTPQVAQAVMLKLDRREIAEGRRIGIRFAQKDRGGKQAEKDNAKPGKVAPGGTVFVYDMPLAWGENEVRQHFKHCGTIARLQVIKDAAKSFGFVAYDKAESARMAITGMDGFVTEALRPLIVSPKKDEEHLLPAETQIYPPPGDINEPLLNLHSPPNATVFVFYLPPDWAEPELLRHFIHCGTILSVTLMKRGTESRGFGFISFAHPESAQRAIEGVNGLAVSHGKHLKVTLKGAGGEEEGRHAHGSGQMQQHVQQHIPVPVVVAPPMRHAEPQQPAIQNWVQPEAQQLAQQWISGAEQQLAAQQQWAHPEAQQQAPQNWMQTG